MSISSTLKNILDSDSSMVVTVDNLNDRSNLYYKFGFSDSIPELEMFFDSQEPGSRFLVFLSNLPIKDSVKTIETDRGVISVKSIV